jgi:hypothetical protein
VKQSDTLLKKRRKHSIPESYPDYYEQLHQYLDEEQNTSIRKQPSKVPPNPIPQFIKQSEQPSQVVNLM